MIFNKNYFFIISFSSICLLPISSTYAENYNNSLSTFEIRSLQTRDFPNINSDQAYQAAISTFQNLGFIITETSQSLKVIEANQMHPDNNEVILATLTLSTPQHSNHITARLSLSTYPILAGEEGMNLGGSAPRRSELIKTPSTYQQFFDAFSYSLQQYK